MHLLKLTINHPGLKRQAGRDFSKPYLSPQLMKTQKTVKYKILVKEYKTFLTIVIIFYPQEAVIW